MLSLFLLVILLLYINLEQNKILFEHEGMLMGSAGLHRKALARDKVIAESLDDVWEAIDTLSQEPEGSGCRIKTNANL